jgi:CDP-diacylglycerol--serine O-phosphatidyltransferase
MRFRTLIKISDFVTLASVACGMLSIILVSKQNFDTAAVLLMLAAFLDWLDGEVAALIKRKGRFGAELDSLADAVSFGAAPALFGYFLGLKDILSIIILIIFAMASILRLARFNVIKKMVGYFIGLPTTANGIGLPLLYLILKFTNLPWNTSKWIFLAYFLLASILMVSSLKM